MKRELRIIDGVCRVANIDAKGNIISIVGDYQKPKIDERKIREYEESEKIRHETDIKLVKQEKENEKRKAKIAEEEKIHEIHHGKRHKYQRYDKVTKGPNQYRKNLLKKKVALGLIDEMATSIKSNKELLDNWARGRHFYNYEEYLNIIALGRGFTCYGEYEKVQYYYPGMPDPIKENRMDKRFIGVYIAENGVAKIYEESKRMPYNNPGYDIICPRGYKIDVKATVLNQHNMFGFGIKKNKVADYFALVGFNNIIELEPLRMWIIRNDEYVNKHKISELSRFVIPNERLYIEKYQKYEKFDKLDMLKNVCKEFDAKNKIEIKGYNATTRREMLDTIIQIRSEIHGNISPIDMLFMLEKKKKETISGGLRIVPGYDIIKPYHY